MKWPRVQVRHVARFGYGDSLPTERRVDGPVPVYGSNGRVGIHDAANTVGPTIVVGRKGSHGRLQFSLKPVFAIDTTYFVDRRLTSHDIRWLYYALQTARLEELSQDVGVPGLNREDAYSQRIALPERAAQRAIADFLDTETARIEALITKKCRMMELLDEQHLAQWAHIVLPVGGDLPDGWEWLRARHVCPDVTVGVVVDPSSYFAAEGVPFIHGTDVRRGWIDESSFKSLSDADNATLAKSRIRAGDVLAMRVGEPGRAAVVPAHLDGANCASVLIFRRSTRLASELLAAFLNSRVGRSQIEAMQYGAAQGVLNVAHARELRVPVPPIEAQPAMVEKLRRIETVHERIQSALSDQISLLKEHRQALITAAVTGELAVPGVAA